ncbi:Formylglycine-generating enzyme, required for sulfatase activity, contains SUMF1/FGE domain [Nonomuraea solani]|uniref:Formylglycine-generating enzyme, required for sulfatase activity, contains SUMF1/FGE domain n=1 Tax=Nonomuraea solani TaxID=1144553 RepID=A0A1H6EYM9_9ACTN|nr:formylglycine-generating enzyme family protein [Nonomuraea solani]SEH02987.1 Formylglycine-generating enzyme, required for sulfatase activity, contains SUMF1/FGE domain [Nonomuraea solani]
MTYPDPERTSCCAPRRTAGTRAEPAANTAANTAHSGAHLIEQCPIEAGTFRMGDPFGDGLPGDGESPVHEVWLDAFDIDATTVTNADFTRFIDATDHRTEAETAGSSAVFHTLVRPRATVIGSSPRAPWWLAVEGASRRRPEGPGSDLYGREDHPVTHVTWNDAQAYCVWAGRRLPTEAEWERASRGGLEGARYPWGDELLDANGQWQVNIWQGTFPRHNTGDDGWPATAPVRAYQPNGFGLWQTVGNVWEWCDDPFDSRAYAKRARAQEPAHNPRPRVSPVLRVLRGGSYLCHDSYCNRYRNAARSSNTPDSSMGNAGFRTVAL